VDATVEARLKEERASQPTSIPGPTSATVPQPTNTPTFVSTATSVPTPTPKTLMPNEIRARQLLAEGGYPDGWRECSSGYGDSRLDEALELLGYDGGNKVILNVYPSEIIVTRCSSKVTAAPVPTVIPTLAPGDVLTDALQVHVRQLLRDSRYEWGWDSCSYGYDMDEYGSAWAAEEALRILGYGGKKVILNVTNSDITVTICSSTPTPVPMPTAVPTPRPISTPVPTPRPSPTPMPTPVPADDNYILVIDQANGDFAGKAISFKVNGTIASETAQWKTGGSTELNLSSFTGLSRKLPAINPTIQISFVSQMVPPHVFIGTAYIDGVPAPNGTVVSAWIDGEMVAETRATKTSAANKTGMTPVVFEDLANYGDNLIIVWKFVNSSQDWVFYSPDKNFLKVNTYGGASAGDTVWVKVNREQKFQAGTLYPGWNLISLDASTPSPTPIPTPTRTPKPFFESFVGTASYSIQIGSMVHQIQWGLINNSQEQIKVLSAKILGLFSEKPNGFELEDIPDSFIQNEWSGGYISPEGQLTAYTSFNLPHPEGEANKFHWVWTFSTETQGTVECTFKVGSTSCVQK
jgi:hypothetical protein